MIKIAITLNPPPVRDKCRAGIHLIINEDTKCLIDDNQWEMRACDAFTIFESFHHGFKFDTRKDFKSGQVCFGQTCYRVFADRTEAINTLVTLSHSLRIQIVNSDALREKIIQYARKLEGQKEREEREERERLEKDKREREEKERKAKEDVENFVAGSEERFALAELKSSLIEKAAILSDIIDDARKCLQVNKENKHVDLQLKLANEAYRDTERKILAEKQHVVIKRELASLRTQWFERNPRQILIAYEQLTRQSVRDLSLYDVLFERSCFCLEAAKQSTYQTQQRMLYQKANEDLRRVCQHDPFNTEALSLLDQVEERFRNLSVSRMPERSTAENDRPEITRADLTPEQIAKLEEMKTSILTAERDRLSPSTVAPAVVNNTLFFASGESTQGRKRDISIEDGSGEIPHQMRK